MKLPSSFAAKSLPMLDGHFRTSLTLASARCIRERGAWGTPGWHTASWAGWDFSHGDSAAAERITEGSAHVGWRGVVDALVHAQRQRRVAHGCAQSIGALSGLTAAGKSAS
jgi:hypothetical protein